MSYSSRLATGKLVSVTLADPGAGAQFAALTVPSGFAWLLMAARFRVVTDATVTNRYPGYSITDGTGEIFDILNSNALVASQTNDCAFGLGLGLGGSTGGATSSNRRTGPLPLVYLPGGSQIIFTVSNLQAGDVCSTFRGLVQQFVE